MKIPFTHKEVSVGQLFSKYLFPMVASTFVEFTALTPWRRDNGAIVLFGHDLNGNLAAFDTYLRGLPDAPRVLFMTDSAQTYRRERAAGRGILYSARVGDLYRAARADVIVTSHGPINLFRWPKRRHRPLFVDVWHGVGYKTDPKTLASMTAYDGHFVASPLLRDLHIGFGLPAELNTITGYARTDELATLELTPALRSGILRDYGLDPAEKRTLVLYAPTWNHLAARDIFPFGMTPEQFLAPLDALAAEIGVLFLVRLHLNTVLELDESAYANVRFVSARLYPATEPLLKVADVLFTDWSSIVSEYLAVHRPIIFIDKPTPFDGEVQPLSREDRPGAIVASFEDLTTALTLAATDPAGYLEQYGDLIDATTERAWGGTLDGHSAERYLRQIETLRAAK
ncbi:CDP-glycerol glycerophosphotransferase family protein [Glaciihabitans sp. dw_435]|uniref:CDP-glycerol glycerophosphotransferase family protein n=1 Tax=Glaciihabitans sp. dw_435 TaxID=2720081 RepID=UPI001BD38E03|nr:CDP-glycerol glycerophosphotransferase family protein [Glaciihabitans sp. dw_435]